MDLRRDLQHKNILEEVHVCVCMYVYAPLELEKYFLILFVLKTMKLWLFLNCIQKSQLVSKISLPSNALYANFRVFNL